MIKRDRSPLGTLDPNNLPNPPALILPHGVSFKDDPEIYSTNSGQGIISNEPKKTAWSVLKKTAEAVWMTKQTISKDADKESLIKTTLRELLIYVTFLATVSVIAFSMMSPTMFYQTKILSELFLDASTSKGVTFRTANQMDHFWNFAEEVLIPNLYWDRWYNNKSTTTSRSILYENYLLGSPRMRQLRVRNDSCQVHPDFKRAISFCYNNYADYLEDRSVRIPNEPGFTYQPIKSFARNDVWGKLASYSGDGGYIVDLSLDKAQAYKILKNLKDNLWIDRGTRVVFVDFTVYNPNVNLFVVTKLISEFPATGGMLTSWQFRTLNLLQNSGNSKLTMVAFGFFGFFILYYLVEELLEIHNLSFFPYIKDSFWNTLDLLTIGLGFLLLSFSIYRRYIIDKIFAEANEQIAADAAAEAAANLKAGLNSTSLLTTSYMMETYKFDTLGFWSAQFNNMLALLTFIVWVKLFKYISFNKTMSQLSSTLSRCSKDIAGFGVMFFIVFFAFAQLGYLLFGTQVKDYSSFGNAVFTLLRTILGDFDFYQLEQANRVLGPIFFLCYIFFVFFVLMNMFLAIINDTYAEVKAEINESADDFRLVDYFKNSYAKMFNKLSKEREQLEDIQSALKSTSQRKLSFNTVRAELKKKNLSDQEIETLFNKYDCDANRELDEDELRQMMEDLEGKKRQIEREIQEQQQQRPESASEKMAKGFKQAIDDMQKLTRRVDRMEYTLTAIDAKIDAVLGGVPIAPNAANKESRRDTMKNDDDSVFDSVN